MMNEPEDIQDEPQEVDALPFSTQAVVFGGTLASGLVIDLAAHGGWIGLIAAGVIAYTASRNGPDILAPVLDHAPRLPARRARTPHADGRSLADRLLGCYPEETPEAGTPAWEETFPPMSPDRVPAALPVLPSSETLRPAASSPRAVRRDPYLHLAQDFHPHIEEIIGLGIVCYGIKGSGKTNSGALLAEQIGRAGYVPFVVFDLEGDYHTVIEVVPNGYQAGSNPAETAGDSARYLTIDAENASEMAAVILAGGYQVVLDLQSYADDETRAQIMTRLISGLMRYAESLPNESRVPCLVFIDEAAHWFPQTSTMSYLLPLTQQALTRAVFEVVTTGRKRGIIPAFFTQRPADFDKRLAAQADLLILMRQRQDVDLARYKEYLGEQAKTAATFGRGEAVLILPDGEKLHTTFYPRQSRHVSHTPTAETAYQRFAPSPLSREQVPGTGPGARSERRYTFHPAVPGTTATGGNSPSSTTEQDGTEGTSGNLFPVQQQPVPRTSSEPHHRFTREQEAEFVRQYQRLGSIKAAITAMHVSYGRYQWHASQIIRARTGRKA